MRCWFETFIESFNPKTCLVTLYKPYKLLVCRNARKNNRTQSNSENEAFKSRERESRNYKCNWKTCYALLDWLKSESRLPTTKSQGIYVACHFGGLHGFPRKWNRQLKKLTMSKLNFHQYIKTAKPKKKDRDFCTRSASAQFHPGLTEVT